MSAAPVTNPMNSGIGLTNNLVSDGTYRYACWYTIAGELMMGVQLISTEVWTTAQVVGLARIALKLPLGSSLRWDTHRIATLVRCGDGHFKIFANMHDDAMQEITSFNTITPSSISWIVGDDYTVANTVMTGVLAHNTYPMPIYHPNGSVRLYMRDGPVASGAGRSDSHFWDMAAGTSRFGSPTKIFKGLSVANAGGAGVTGDDQNAGDTMLNWSVYNTNTVVTDDGAGGYIEHWAWVWRRSPHVTFTDTDGVITGSTNLQSNTGAPFEGNKFNADMVGCTVTEIGNAHIPDGTTISAFVNDSNVTLSQACTNGTGITFTVDGNGRGVNITPSYMQYRSATNSWYAWDGSSVTLPVDPINNTNVQMIDSATSLPMVPISPDKTYLNEGGLCVDDDGNPHWILSRNPHYHVRPSGSGSTWTQTKVTTSSGVIGLYAIASRLNCYWMNGQLWMLGMGGKLTDPVAKRQVPRVFRLDGTCQAPLGGFVPGVSEGSLWDNGSGVVNSGDGVDYAGGWEPTADPIALRDRGVIEVLTPRGDAPHVYQFGSSARYTAS